MLDDGRVVAMHAYTGITSTTGLKGSYGHSYRAFKVMLSWTV